MPADPAAPHARKHLASLWVRSELGDREALTELRRTWPLWRREWESLPIDDRARARVEAR